MIVCSFTNGGVWASPRCEALSRSVPFHGCTALTFQYKGLSHNSAERDHGPILIFAPAEFSISHLLCRVAHVAIPDSFKVPLAVAEANLGSFRVPRAERNLSRSRVPLGKAETEYGGSEYGSSAGDADDSANVSVWDLRAKGIRRIWRTSRTSSVDSGPTEECPGAKWNYASDAESSWQWWQSGPDDAYEGDTDVDGEDSNFSWFNLDNFDMLSVYLWSSVEGVCGSKEFESELLYRGKTKLLSRSYKKKDLANRWYSDVLLAALINIPAFLSFTDSAHAESSSRELHMIYGDIGAGLDLGVQVLYLAALLGLIGVGSFFVVRQLLIRRELESAAKDLQDRVRTGEALPVEYFELGAVMLRKKFFVLAAKYLEQAIEKWDGDPQDLAQVHNALGFSLVSDGKIDEGIAEYEKAVKLQPGYVIAWNNLGSAYEKKKNLPKALKAYEQALFFDPNNSVAREYRDAVKIRVDRLAGVPVKYD